VRRAKTLATAARDAEPRHTPKTVNPVKTDPWPPRPAVVNAR
jgi:hypothetical protein